MIKKLNRIKFMKRYNLDVGNLKTFKKYTSTRLNMISNMIFLLKNDIFQILNKKEKVTSYKRGRVKKALTVTYRIGRQIFERKIKKKKMDLKKMNRMFLKRLIIFRLFRKYYLNLKVKQLQTLLKEVKGNETQFLCKLEKRLDMVLLRSGLFKSIFEVRQFINHRQIIVDGHIADKPGYEIKVGALIGIKEGKKKTRKRQEIIKNILRQKRDKRKAILAKRKGIKYYPKLRRIRIGTPSYLETDRVLMLTTLIREPKLTDIKYPFTLDEKKKIHFVNILKTQKRLR